MRAAVVVGAVVMLMCGPHDAGAANAAKASVKCRKAIGQNALKAVTAGLKAIQQCHARQLKKNQPGDCNALGGSAFDQAQTQAVARIGVACKDGDPVLSNYVPPSTAGLPPVFDAIQRVLEQSGAALQALPGFQGDPQAKAKGKCSNSVGGGRTGVVKAALKAAFKCQKGIDKSATTFGPLADSCRVGSGGAATKASGKVAKACTGLSGLEVGSCAGLPDCVVADAESAAQRIARLAFGGPAVCGNGIQDQGEECDDGNQDENDECRTNCRVPRCGDLVVNQASEQCDEEDSVGGDSPSDNCYQCRTNVCGDGFKDTQEPVIEECDDGNTTGGDGCTDCTVDPVLCDANGLTVELALEYPLQTLGGVQATALHLSYPAVLSIPGTGSESSVRSRVTSLLPSGFRFLGRDSDSNSDNVDDLVRTEAIAPDLTSIGSQKVASIQFDCQQGTPVRGGDLPCTVVELVNAAGEPYIPELRALASCVVSISGGVAPTTTTTTSTSSTVISPPTTSTTISASCGNGMVDGTDECDDGNSNPNDGCTNACTLCGNNNITAPETCDDGNNLVDDDCPEDCQIGQCTPTASPVQTITITASRADLSSIRFLLDYPDGRVAMPGGPGSDVPAGTFTDTPGDPDPFDVEHAVRVVVSAGFTFDTTTIARVGFLGCEGQPVPSAGDYRCIVIDAADGNFQNVTGVTCAVSTDGSATTTSSTSTTSSTPASSTTTTSSTTITTTSLVSTTTALGTSSTTTSSTSSTSSTTTTSSSTITTTSLTSTTTLGTSTTTSPTSTSTSTTTGGEMTVCSATGLDVTVGLDYPVQIVGSVSAILVKLNYPPPLVIPGTGTEATVRARVTNLVGTGSTIGGVRDSDTNANSVDDEIQAFVRKTQGSINPGPFYRVRFDCPAGTSISPSSLSCTKEQATDGAGSPFIPEIANLINCVFSLSAP